MKVKWVLRYWSGYEWIDLHTFEVEVPKDNFTACETEEEKNSVIDFYVNKDFDRKIDWEWKK